MVNLLIIDPIKAGACREFLFAYILLMRCLPGTRVYLI